MSTNEQLMSSNKHKWATYELLMSFNELLMSTNEQWLSFNKHKWADNEHKWAEMNTNVQLMSFDELW